MAFNMGGASAGAGMGATAGPWGALAGGILGGLFGGESGISPEQRRILNFQMRAAKDLRTYSQGVPGSDPQELQLLASQRGLLGQQQRGMMGGLFGNLGAEGSPAPLDLLQNLGTQFAGQQAAAQSNLFGQFFQNRRNALLQSAQVASGALGSAQPNQPGFDFGAIFGPLAQAYAYRRSLQGAQLQRKDPAIVNVGGGVAPPSGFNFGPGLGLENVTFNPGQLQRPTSLFRF